MDGERQILFLKFYELCVGVVWLCSALSLSLKHTQKVTWHPLYVCVYMSVGQLTGSCESLLVDYKGAWHLPECTSTAVPCKEGGGGEQSEQAWRRKE